MYSFGRRTTVMRCLMMHLLLCCAHPGCFAFMPDPLRRTTTTPLTRSHIPVHPTTQLFSKKKKKKTPAPPEEANHEKWQPYFDKLVEYKEAHGNLNVPEDEEPLGPWLKDQRHHYLLLTTGKKTKLTTKRGKALVGIGAIPSELLA
jgi:hypothetical protein